MKVGYPLTVYQVLLVLMDVLLLALATMRVTRLITTDSIGQKWIYKPIARRGFGHQPPRRWADYVDGLQCPFCVGFWVGVVGAVTLLVAGGPGHADDWWRLLAGVFALNYVVGHVSSRLD